MFVIAIHHIHDPAGFEVAEARAMAAGLPAGISLPADATSPDHRLRVFICMGASVTAVRDVVEAAVGRFADSEYYELRVFESAPF